MNSQMLHGAQWNGMTGSTEVQKAMLRVLR